MRYIYVDAKFNSSDTKYAPCWEKVWVLARLLKAADPPLPIGSWIFFLDSDAFIEQQDLHVFDLMEAEGVMPGDVVASFFGPEANMGIGNGEMLFRVNKNLVDFVDQWGTIIERGFCEKLNYKDGNRDMTCMRDTLRVSRVHIKRRTP
jgi:hypothetical protein